LCVAVYNNNNNNNNNGYSALGAVWQEPEPTQATGMTDTLHPGQVLGGSLPLLSPGCSIYEWEIGKVISRLTSTLHSKTGRKGDT
jgi:hypothetical protein